MKSRIERILREYKQKTKPEALSPSHAEITQACDDAIKKTVLADRDTVAKNLLSLMISERKSAYKGTQRE